jgi:hypothetical protein
MKYYFCELLKQKLKQTVTDCKPIVITDVVWIRQSYNKQQHTVRVEAQINHEFMDNLGIEIRNTFWHLLYKRFHHIRQWKHRNFHIINHYYPPIVAKQQKWGLASSINGYTEGFSRKVRELMELHYINDKIHHPLGKGFQK